jgi:nitrogen regulatory protein PII
MQLIKRIEIIANSFELGKILAKLDKSGINGHAVIRNVAGKGLREGSEDLDMSMYWHFVPPIGSRLSWRI